MKVQTRQQRVVDKLIEFILKEFNVTMDQLKSTYGSKQEVRARACFSYNMRLYGGFSHQEIVDYIWVGAQHDRAVRTAQAWDSIVVSKEATCHKIQTELDRLMPQWVGLEKEYLVDGKLCSTREDLVAALREHNIEVEEIYN